MSAAAQRAYRQAARAPDEPDNRFLRDVLDGLARQQKAIPPKYFYDAEGSRLFDAICALEEYYPTRTEIGILSRHAREIAGAIGPGAVLVEFGAGSAVKVRHILDAARDLRAFVPIDISGEHLIEASGALAADYPGLTVLPVVADFTGPLALDSMLPAGRRVGFFPGSTIGNFDPPEASALLGRFAAALGPGAGLVIGVDLEKPVPVLEAAYDDARGVTAAFNLNLLGRINRELGADFDLSAFAHRAVWNPESRAVEMHLVASRAQRVTVAGQTFDFAAGDTIHTESSYKYTVPRFHRIAEAAGWRADRLWTDPDRLFSLHYLTTS
ncbi:L-histidine N(alpha)-methyltransferase [Faunimonas sp. B44]|uniref:L-histidine N(alpha)-methyltransferase n=1 Tax=Faunimonas sp. B44 TaxID=3461493 RepID=UPI00404515A8